MPDAISAGEALELLDRPDAAFDIGSSSTPLVVIDLRRVSRSLRQHNRDRRLIAAAGRGPWITCGLVDHASLNDAPDVALGLDLLLACDGVHPEVVTVTDLALATDEVATAVSESPIAAVAVAQLLRRSHDMSVHDALTAESVTYGLLQTSEHFTRWLEARRSATHSAAGHEASEPAAVLTELTGSHLTIALNRPDRANALNVEMRDALAEALALVATDMAIDGATLHGYGTTFSAGGDLNEFGTTPSPATGHYVRSIRSLPSALHAVADRVRVLVHGTCVGAGIELPAFAHSVIAHPDTSFRLPEVGFGLIPGAGGTVSLPRRCGRHRTAWLAITGREIDASTALQWGLVDRIDASAAAR